MGVSVIIPSYNSEGTIRQTLEAIMNQDFKDYDVTVVDDGSEDNTCELVGEYKLKLLKQEHKGPATARNLGARTAEGEILLFTDADCIPEIDWISQMVRSFEDKNIVGVQGRYKTTQLELIARFAQYEIEERYERMMKNKYIDFIGTYSAAYKRDIFLDEGGFDESFRMASGEDPDLSFRLASKGYKMVFNSNASVYHTHPDSLGEYVKQKFFRARWRVPLYKKNYKKTIKESYTPQTLKLQIGIFYLFLLSIIILPFYRVLYLPFILFLIFSVFTLPLSFRIYKKDKNVGVLTPIMVTLRTIAFATGLIYGFFISIKH